MTPQRVLVGFAVVAALVFTLVIVVSAALDVGHTTWIEVNDDECVVEITVDVWGHQTDRTEVCP